MLRTAAAACLHRLSTGLCTASLDAHQRWRQTVGAVRYNGYEWPARAAAGMPTEMGEVAPVSVAEIAPRGEEFERTPPHDLAAEQCVLGGMLMSKDAISDVLEVIHPGDHYRPAHQLVHEVILDLYSRGEPADAVTVANELTKRGEITRVGGAPYLHTLIASVPTAANAGYYARIVRERAILRRLVEAGTRIVQLGYSGDGDADEIVDRAEAEVYSVTARRVSEDYLALAEIMPGALDEIEAIGSRGGGLTGVPTGFADLDALTNGLHPGQMIVIAARPALGQGLGSRYTAADADRLDHDGPGGRRRSASSAQTGGR